MLRILFLLAVLASTGCGFYTVSPGYTGVRVTLGSVDSNLVSPGFGLKLPLITSVYEIPSTPQTFDMVTEAYSVDLQPTKFHLTVTYRIPTDHTITLFSMYGEHVDKVQAAILAPRIAEAVKQQVTNLSSDQMVKKREAIKHSLSESVVAILKDFVIVDNISITNIDLSEQLEKAIESKMVQEQEAEKAKFVKQRAEVEAETILIEARSQAQALQIQGEALRKNPETMQMELIKKWNGVSPLVVGGGSGTNILLPVNAGK